jgi:Dynamin family
MSRQEPKADVLPLSPTDLRLHVERGYDQIKSFIAKRGTDRLQSRWPEWNERFQLLFKRLEQRPEVAISLVGGTGAGKSTLLNAMIGVRVLPVSTMRACTAAICEVSYAEGPYLARIEFIPREAWLNEVNLLLADYRDAESGTDDDAANPRIEMSRAVTDKLWTVYRATEETDRASFDPSKLVEPPEITAALDSGFQEVASLDVNLFRKQVARYLESKHRFWPIVKSVAIRGPFESLKDGAKIIDLPGLNDPNESREAVTKQHLKTCRFVWLVFNIKRVLTRDMFELIQSEDFMRQIVMDGRADSLTFVGTASDDINVVTGREEFELDEDAPKAEVIAARNREVRKVIGDQLDQLAERLASLAGEQRETAFRLSKRLKASNVFTISAQEHLRLCGLMKTDPAGLTDVDQAEITALVNHMHRISAAHGIAAECKSLFRQFELIYAEIQNELDSQHAVLKNRADASEQGRKEMKAALDAARTFLDRDLDDTCERLVQDLEAHQSLLAERVKRAVIQGRQELDRAFQRWNGMHAGTIKAVCRRGGRHKGVQLNDFPEELSKPILDSIAFAWSDFFGEKLGLTMEKWTDRLLKNADAYCTRLVTSLSKLPDLSSTLLDNLQQTFKTAEQILREILAQAKNNMDERVVHQQRTLYDRVPEQVQANMSPAFDRAAQEHGSGVRQRIVDILATHARQVSQVMFDDAREAVLAGVRGLNDWLAREFAKMTETIRRHASLAADNLISSGERMTADAIAIEQSILNELDELLSATQQGAAA